MRALGLNNAAIRQFVRFPQLENGMYVCMYVCNIDWMRQTHIKNKPQKNRMTYSTKRQKPTKTISLDKAMVHFRATVAT